MRDKIVRKLSTTRLIGIYEIINKINGKSYIGQSIDIERRWNQHRYGKGSIILKNAIKKYGIESFDFNILELVDGSGKTKDEVIILLTNIEQKWLDDKQTFIKENGYNIQQSAKPNIPKSRPKDYGELISKIKLDNNHCGKTVYQFDKKGNLIRKWKSAAEAERHLGFHAENISACCLGKQKTSNGYIWKFDDVPLSEKELNSINKRVKPITRKIKQISLDGEIVNVWDSFKQLVNNSEFDNRPVKKCCNGLREIYKGFRWSFE